MLEARIDDGDDDLARAAAAGDRAAFEALIQRYRGRVCAFARTLLPRPEEAEDAAQETFVRAFRCLSTYEPRGNFRAWLFGIAANVCRETLRGERRRAAHLAGGDELEHGAAGSFSEGDRLHAQTALKAAVRAAIQRLPHLYREPVVLHYLDDLSVAEVAEILGRSPSAVKVQLWRARTLLARELSDWID